MWYPLLICVLLKIIIVSLCIVFITPDLQKQYLYASTNYQWAKSQPTGKS